MKICFYFNKRRKKKSNRNCRGVLPFFSFFFASGRLDSILRDIQRSGRAGERQRAEVKKFCF